MRQSHDNITIGWGFRMDAETIQRLNAINKAFYAITANEFDATRQQKWIGWDLLLPHIGTPQSVLDVGCGNGRFGAFMAEKFTHEIAYHGIDNNPALLAYARDTLSTHPALRLTLTESDIVNAGITRDTLPDAQYDLVVLFGVLHHIPGMVNRLNFMQSLAAYVAQSGYLVFAAWCFYDHARFRDRIVPWDSDLADKTEKHDYLLDWRRGERALRYCHYVDAKEHQALINATGLEEITTYYADGATNNLNRYSVLKRAPHTVTSHGSNLHVRTF